jgi:hypothetical protein
MATDLTQHEDVDCASVIGRCVFIVYYQGKQRRAEGIRMRYDEGVIRSWARVRSHTAFSNIGHSSLSTVLYATQTTYLASVSCSMHRRRLEDAPSRRKISGGKVRYAFQTLSLFKQMLGRWLRCPAQFRSASEPVTTHFIVPRFTPGMHAVDRDYCTVWEHEANIKFTAPAFHVWWESSGRPRTLTFVYSLSASTPQRACLRTLSHNHLVQLSKELFKKPSSPYHPRVARNLPMVRPTVPVTSPRTLLMIRNLSIAALLQHNALDEAVSASRGSHSTGQTSGPTRQGGNQHLIPRPPTKRRRRGYHLIEKMGLDKNKPDEHMKYKRIQVSDPNDARVFLSNLTAAFICQKDVREQSQRILDQSKTFGNQPTALVDELKRTVRQCCCSYYYKTADPC